MKRGFRGAFRQHGRMLGGLALGLLAIMTTVCSAGVEPEEQVAVRETKDEYAVENVQLVQSGQNADLTVNPFVDMTQDNNSQAGTGPEAKAGNSNRSLPAISAVYPPSQPRPVLPLPNIPRPAPQNQAAVASAPAPAKVPVEAAPKENMEARIAFLGGGDIMFTASESGK